MNLYQERPDGTIHPLVVILDETSGKVIMQNSFVDEFGITDKYQSKIYYYQETGEYEMQFFKIIDNNGQAKTICNGYLC